jgi:hypothetical protein
LIWISTDTLVNGTVTVRERAVVAAPLGLVPTMDSFHLPGVSVRENVKVPSADVAAVSGFGPGVGEGLGRMLADGPKDALGEAEGEGVGEGEGEGTTGGVEAPAARGGPRYVGVRVTEATSVLIPVTVTFPLAMESPSLGVENPISGWAGVGVATGTRTMSFRVGLA